MSKLALWVYFFIYQFNYNKEYLTLHNFALLLKWHWAFFYLDMKQNAN